MRDIFRNRGLLILLIGAYLRSLIRLRRPTILLFGAHPDDITYAAGGLAAVARSLRFRVVEVIATAGQAGSHDEGQWPSHSMGAVRIGEQHQANAVLGIQTIFLEHQDGHLHRTRSRLAAELKQLLRRFRPAIVVTYGPDGLTGHEDHRCLSDLVTRMYVEVAIAGAQLWYIAATHRFHENVRRPLDELAAAFYGPEYPFAAPSGAIVLSLPARILARKVTAATMHKSQKEPLDAALEDVGGFQLVVKEWFPEEAYYQALIAA